MKEVLKTGHKVTVTPASHLPPHESLIADNDVIHLADVSHV